jgi:hypothetical protein
MLASAGGIDAIAGGCDGSVLRRLRCGGGAFGSFGARGLRTVFLGSLGSFGSLFALAA